MAGTKITAAQELAGATLARLKAGTLPRDDHPDEEATVRIGDLWVLLDELERLQEQRARIVGYLRAWANTQELDGKPADVCFAIRRAADLVERRLDEPPDPEQVEAWMARVRAL